MERNESVMCEWTYKLPFMQQALLMLATRGADGLHKSHPSKYVLHFYRAVVIKPADPNYDKNGNDGFMREDWLNFDDYANMFFKSVDELPHHFFMHLIHAAEVIAYKHPDENIACIWRQFYYHACESFHMNSEREEQLNQRLNK